MLSAAACQPFRSRALAIAQDVGEHLLAEWLHTSTCDEEDAGFVGWRLPGGACDRAGGCAKVVGRDRDEDLVAALGRTEHRQRLLERAELEVGRERVDERDR